MGSVVPAKAGTYPTVTAASARTGRHPSRGAETQRRLDSRPGLREDGLGGNDGGGNPLSPRDGTQPYSRSVNSMTLLSGSLA